MSNPFLRYGLTSGAACAAAAKAATLLARGQKSDCVGIPTPLGLRLEIPISRISKLARNEAEAVVIKDAGANPDITHGIEFVAKVKLVKRGNSIVVKGGKGIGIATKSGLPIPKGSYAINPVPKKMIEEAVREALPKGYSADIELTVPKGEQVARKTLNPRLGIVGGISILGTTGIEEPVSTPEYLGHLQFLIDRAACITKTLVLTPGNSGLAFAKKLFDIPDEGFILVGDKVGDAIDHAVERGVNELILCGLPGKLVKVAAGAFNTHSRVADARFETIAAISALYGASSELTRKILETNTVDSAIALLDKAGMTDRVFNDIAARISSRIVQRTGHKVRAGAAITSSTGRILGIDEHVKKMRTWKKT